MGKFNKRQLGVFGFGFLAIVLVCGFAALSVSAENSDPAFCGKSNKVLFGFNDEHHTQFSIPEAYLYDPYHAYHKVKDPAEFISLRLDKNTLKPACADKERGLDHGKLLVLTIKPNRFENILSNRKRVQSIKIGQNNEFDIYRDKWSAASSDLRTTDDLLIPKDKDYIDKILMECSHPRNTKEPDHLTGCTVYAKTTDTTYLIYTIDSKELPEYQVLDKKIIQFMKSIMVDSK
jgi:hypothetical protein